MRTAVNANSHVFPIPRQTVNAKKAFNPIPGANTKGNLAQVDMMSVAMKEAIAVAVNTAPLSIPVMLKMLGLTAKI